MTVANHSASRRQLPILALLGVLLATTVTVSTVAANFTIHREVESHAQKSAEESAVVAYVDVFMVKFATIDPLHANDYFAEILQETTGKFADSYKQKENEILLQVARAQPATGRVIRSGLEKWNDDGSANVLVATTTIPNPGVGGSPGGSASPVNRWVATARKVANQWKISDLVQVI